MMRSKGGLHRRARVAEFVVVVEELVQAGTLQVIRPGLRALLDEPMRMVQSLYEYETDQYIGTVERIFLNGPVKYGKVANVRSRIAAGAPPSDLERLWGDRRFWNLAGQKLETIEDFLEPTTCWVSAHDSENLSPPFRRHERTSP